jgi:hypothetical protein
MSVWLSNIIKNINIGETVRKKPCLAGATDTEKLKPNSDNIKYMYLWNYYGYTCWDIKIIWLTCPFLITHRPKWHLLFFRFGKHKIHEIFTFVILQSLNFIWLFALPWINVIYSRMFKLCNKLQSFFLRSSWGICKRNNNRRKWQYLNW